jgi:iron complex transport system substrate-binding protein
MKRNDHRIVSLLPSATEIACALGLGDRLVGITHCCSYPKDEIEGKPVVVRSALPIDEMSLREIDVAVAERVRQGQSLYLVDEVLLRELAPTLLLTQDLCQVCAPAGNEIARALEALATKPEVIWMSPHSLADIQSDILTVGETTEHATEARRLIGGMERRIERIRRACADVACPRVFCAEWLDPLYCSGHWVPEMVEIAGGQEVLGRKWKDSVRVSWESVRAAEPEAIIVMACGMSCLEAAEAADWLRALPGFDKLPAARDERIYAVDAAYFSTPGPRVADGVELLAHLIHPECCEWLGAADAFAPVRRRTSSWCGSVAPLDI